MTCAEFLDLRGAGPLLDHEIFEAAVAHMQACSTCRWAAIRKIAEPLPDEPIFVVENHFDD